MEFQTISNTRVFVPHQSVLLIQKGEKDRAVIVLNNGTQVYALTSYDRVITLFGLDKEWF